MIPISLYSTQVQSIEVQVVASTGKWNKNWGLPWGPSVFSCFTTCFYAYYITSYFIKIEVTHQYFQL